MSFDCLAAGIYMVSYSIFVHKGVEGSVVIKKLIQSVILVACWLIWRTRSSLISKDYRRLAI
ncbi:hypothetical protein HanRHA438_Chr13g0615211 [Helianthus annuus]|uniref:Uncharacterized protein n=1 Tax=Helianthus annuus TaxID=4232 RepID=A0A9K3EJF2_HELAN|nr:hypothetical protein HanXRQr2_Chr13g0604741 [Helianthus annuus]KAJ0482706.1 hypothetical protein HanIR_Chr13g0656881 [Helianthus annuus]KAJ0850608.1 hypothetical protein HanPSC8_Chr13g0582751 [Helianthus annuus]KAJ0859670.1 hypothetical protein HanRHA438_Chr13g0615211 [Helianthus annuus]